MNDMMNDNNIPQQEGMEEQPTRVVPTVDAPAPRTRHRRSDRYLDEQPVVQAPQQPVQNEAPAWMNQAPAAPQQPSWLGQEQPMQPPVQENGFAAENPESTTRVQTRFSSRQGMQQPVPRPAVLNRQPGAEDNNVRRPMNVPGYTQRQPLGTGPVQPHPRQPLHQQQETPARRNQPQNVPEKKKKKGRGWLIALVILVLLIGLCVLGFLMIDENTDTPLAEAKRSVVSLLGGAIPTEAPPAASASGFSAAINTGTAPLDVMFNLTTSKTVTQVRLVDEDKMPLSAVSAALTENADSIIWMINLPVVDGFEGSVQAQIFDGLSWIDTGMFQTLEIAMPVPTATIVIEAFNEVATDAPTAEPVVTDEPTLEPIVTDAPTQVPTEAPTQEPTAAPTEVVTATPTLEPTYTPTLAPTATPTLAPTEEPVIATQEPLVTEAPTEAPTEVPTEAPTAAPTVTPEPTATPEPTPPMTAEAADSADPKLIANSAIYDKKTEVEEYEREKAVNMPAADSYLTLPFGVVTYRGNAFRQNASVGDVGDGVSAMTLAWTAEAGSAKGANNTTYYGIGWTGQPAIIKWSKQIREASNIVDEKKTTSALKEVIVAGMDGKIYFLDLADGLPTRDAINVGFPMRGTPSLHPLGYPVMTVGQYARKMAKTTGDIGLRFYDLLTQKQVYWIDGLDGKDDRPYYAVGAFDTSALIDPTSDTLITVGTNGMLYTANLNTEYDAGKQAVSIDPELVSMKSRTKGQANKYTAVESTHAMYGSYVFYADMEGILRCVDTTTMTTAWAVDTGDAVQAAIALDTDDSGNVWLYTANVLENRKKGDCTIRRFNAETGEEDWAYAINVAKNAAKKNKTPGAMASPVIGQHGLSDLVYFTLSNVSKTGAKELFADADGALAGVTLAMDKNTGDVLWAMELDGYAYSSPVAVYAENGDGWIVQASASGMIYLLDGLTGEVVSTLEVEGTIEGSPAVYNDTLVIGTTGKNTSFIYGVKLQ